ncbi:outer membrane lipoprotein chaperone LolA [Alteromonadaceae bacterium BrNp21-10]|nr:outer membrane lipoprotein chaperone LolA [Alteromonadaceae bacterium BrNp21-10]
MKYALLLLSLMSLNTFAADAVRALKTQLSALTTFSAQFTQEVTDAQQEVLQQAEGVLKLQQPNKMFWEVKEPNENILIADGDTLWHIDPFVEQVTAVEQVQATANNPMVLLAQPDSAAWGEYNIEQQGQRFDIIAKEQTSQIAKLVLVFAEQQLVELHIHNRQQQITSMHFSDIQQGGVLSAETFIFSLPDGFALDDQRRVTATGL